MAKRIKKAAKPPPKPPPKPVAKAATPKPAPSTRWRRQVGGSKRPKGSWADHVRNQQKQAQNDAMRRKPPGKGLGLG